MWLTQFVFPLPCFLQPWSLPCVRISLSPVCLRHSWVIYLLLLLQPCFYLQFWGLFDNNCFLKLGWNFTSLPLVDGIRVTASSLVRGTKGEVGGGCTRGRGGCQFSSSAFYSFFIFLFFLRAKPQPQVLNIISKVHKLCLRPNQVGSFLGSGMTGIKALRAQDSISVGCLYPSCLRATRSPL